ncbi:hypothetical protein [Bacillus andreraoultii]|uniref:hypothetical protein n=1 Tax=Bacillus andreraoultii TaxID=1499685 RepID=UPI00053B2EE7|nr:hypothetical protein [Bacillus andreraoultii]
MDKKKIIEENWGKDTIFEVIESHNISLIEFLEIAFELYLYTKNTPNIGRRWTKVEEDFLIKHASQLSVRDASNLLYRSHYATYQRVRFLGLGEMINKK